MFSDHLQQFTGTVCMQSNPGVYYLVFFVRLRVPTTHQRTVAATSTGKTMPFDIWNSGWGIADLFFHKLRFQSQSKYVLLVFSQKLTCLSKSKYLRAKKLVSKNCVFVRPHHGAAAKIQPFDIRAMLKSQSTHILGFPPPCFPCLL